MNASAPTVSVDTATGALSISRLTLENATVTAECRRWSSGHRGEPVDLDQLSDCDVTAFAVQALTVGATAMSAAGDVQQRYGIETLVAEVEQRTSALSPLKRWSGRHLASRLAEPASAYTFPMCAPRLARPAGRQTPPYLAL